MIPADGTRTPLQYDRACAFVKDQSRSVTCVAYCRRQCSIAITRKTVVLIAAASLETCVHQKRTSHMIDEKQREQAAHFMGLRSFARNIGIAEEIAVETYQRELDSLTLQAKITRFVGIIAERRTKDALLDLCRVLSPAAPAGTHPPRVPATERADEAREQTRPRHAAKAAHEKV